MHKLCVSPRRLEEGTRSPGTGVIGILSHHVGSGNTWVLSECSEMLSHLSRPGLCGSVDSHQVALCCSTVPGGLCADQI